MSAYTTSTASPAPDSESVGSSFASKPVATEESQLELTAKRFAFLLGQTALFTHFLRDAIEDEALKEAIERWQPKLQQQQQRQQQTSRDRRHRKTEKEEDEELLYPSDFSTLTVFSESPTYIQNGTLRDYQLQGLNWLISLYENNINGILADEMGLGKTLQVIAFLGYLKFYRHSTKPHLVVVPKTTLHNWVSEFKRWIPTFNVVMLHGTKEERDPLLVRLATQPFDVCITSYEMCMLLKSRLKRIEWEYLIIDEAHRIKNEHSVLSQIIRVFSTCYRLLVTGTPLQNNLHELWALLNFLLPDVFTSFTLFDTWFQTNSSEQDIVSQLHKVLRPFLLRRIKMDVEHSLLPKKEINLYVGLSSMQRLWYQKILEKDLDAVNGLLSGKKEGKTRLLNLVMQLRKCCNHPYLFDGAEPGPPYTTDQHLVDNAGKMLVLDKLLVHFKNQNSKVLVFSQMSRVLDILEDYCLWKSYEYCRIDGQTSHADRITAIDDYNHPDSSKFVFLLTTRAGGLGINLVTANVVILFDSDWNPQVDLQAMDRAHRIGQTKQVFVFRLVTENTIEEKIIERAAQKLRLDQLVIQQGRLTQQQKNVSKNELITMIRHGADQMLQPIDAPSMQADIHEILQRGEEKTKALQSKFSDLGIEDLQRFSSESYQEWQGEDYKNKRKLDIELNWIQPAKRERKANYAVDDYFREALRINVGSSTKAAVKLPRPASYVQAYDFQFYPLRFLELQEKELLYYRKELGTKLPPIEEGEGELKEKERQEKQALIDQAEPLTTKEMEEKAVLMTHGWEHWSRKDFTAFIKGCEKYGRFELEAVANEIEGKSLAQVREYARVFWERYKELNDWERLLSNIEKGELRLKKQVEIQHQLAQKVGQYRLPMHQLKISYQNSKGKHYSEEEDRYLVVKLAQLGYGSEDVYDKIRADIRQSPLFRFDWFFKSRTSLELSRRCHTLVGLIQKEIDALDKRLR